MIRYLITTFSILWFCNSPKENIHIAILSAIITLITISYQFQLYEAEGDENEGND